MSFYNPYLPFVPQLPLSSPLASQLLNPNPFSANFASNLLAPSDFINYRHPLITPGNWNLNDYDSIAYGPSKKCKLDPKAESLTNSSTWNKFDRQNEIPTKIKSQSQEIINIDEDEEDCLIIEVPPKTVEKEVYSPMTQTPFPNMHTGNNFVTQDSFFNQINMTAQKLLLMANLPGPNLLMPSWKLPVPIIPMPTPQELLLLGNTNMCNLQKDLDSTQRCFKEKEIILIDDSDIKDDNSNHQTITQLTQDTEDACSQLIDNQSEENTIVFEHKLNSAELNREFTGLANEETSINAIQEKFAEIEKQKNEEVLKPKSVGRTMNYAKIPSLQRRYKKKKIITRKFKLVWNPSALEPCKVENYFDQIEKAVGMEITDHAKAIQTLKSYNNDVETALSMIKRNKAHYKRFFKVRKLEQINDPYSKVY